MLLLTFFEINFLKKFFQEHYQSVKLFGSRPDLTFCQSWYRFKLFAKAKVAASKQNVKEAMIHEGLDGGGGLKIAYHLNFGNLILRYKICLIDYY